MEKFLATWVLVSFAIVLYPLLLLIPHFLDILKLLAISGFFAFFIQGAL